MLILPIYGNILANKNVIVTIVCFDNPFQSHLSQINQFENRPFISFSIVTVEMQSFLFIFEKQGAENNNKYFSYSNKF